MKQMIELTTDRLILRTPAENDVQDLFRLMNDPEIAANTGFRPMVTPSEAEGKIRRGISDQQMFVIAEKEHPTCIVGVFEVTPHKENTVSGEKCNYEICYFLHGDSRQKGYMTEIVDVMKRYLFIERMADSLTIAVLPRNDLTREEYLNPDQKIDKENIRKVERQKWINEGGILYPIPAYATLLPCPGRGVFRIYEDMRLKRLGLEKIDEAFTFNFKIYDLDCEDIIARVIRTWTSELYTRSGKNLGVIFNGLKGTGKTIAAKLLCNRLGLPVIVISKPMEGMLEFIQSLCFESIILIDEAEKTFDEEQEVLLKMIDGVYNSTRKLYILTTNKLSVDENLLGRPGRIRYIKEFANLSANAINGIIDDNLEDTSLKAGVLQLVDSLEISTIDILKSIIEECNIAGEVPSDSMLNIPRAKYRMQIVTFESLDVSKFQELKDFIKNSLSPNETVIGWLQKTDGLNEENRRKHIALIEEQFNCSIDIRWQASMTPFLYMGQQLRYGTVSREPDRLGFFTLDTTWDETELCCLVNNGERPSLYKGLLF